MYTVCIAVTSLPKLIGLAFAVAVAAAVAITTVQLLARLGTFIAATP